MQKILLTIKQKVNSENGETFDIYNGKFKGKWCSFFISKKALEEKKVLPFPKRTILIKIDETDVFVVNKQYEKNGKIYENSNAYIRFYELCNNKETREVVDKINKIIAEKKAKESEIKID